MEQYSSGRRGASAKGIGRGTGARVQIPSAPPFWPVGEMVNSYAFHAYIHGFESRTGHHLKLSSHSFGE